MSAKVLDALKASHGSAIESLETQHGDEIAWIKRDQLLAVAAWLKDNPAMAFDAPVFSTCIDRLDWKPVDVPPGPPVYPASAPWTDTAARRGSRSCGSCARRCTATACASSARCP